MATRGRDADAEAEPVVAEIADGRVVLDLDDGDRLVLALDELLALEEKAIAYAQRGNVRPLVRRDHGEEQVS